MIGESVTILARVPGADDRYGKPTFTWPLPGVSVAGVLVAPGKAVEGNEAIRDQVDSALTLYRLPPGTVVTAFDRVIVRGRTWFVDGDVAWWDSGSWAPGGVLELKASEG